MKSSKPNSLIIKFKDKHHVHVCHLPSILDLYINIPTQEEWKKIVKVYVMQKAIEDISKTANDISTLKYMSKGFYFKQPHPTVSLVNNPRQVKRACIKTTLLTGIYHLQMTKQKMNKSETGEYSIMPPPVSN